MTTRRKLHQAMSNSFSTPENLDPEAGFTQNPSIGQAANDLRSAAGEKAREFVHAAENKAVEFKERASARAQHLRDSANHQWQDTRVRARELHVTAEDYIRQNPTKCVVSALAIGFLAGLIVRR
jgi:ElaB/YqjD/DUF883 family membrane-anchored ribosome-binding protein